MTGTPDIGEEIALPEPRTDGSVSVEAAIATRRSHRQFGDGSLSLETVAQLLWAAQGITDPDTGFRAAPSAGATFPMEVILTVREGGVDELAPGYYRYRPRAHALECRSTDETQSRLRDAALDQAWVESAPVTIVLAGVDERTERQYGDRGSTRYVPMEAGHVGENVYLQAEALDLGTVAVGAFDDAAVSELLGLDDGMRPLYIFPVGPQPAD